MSTTRWRDLRTDVVAGIPGAISSVPNGMAAAVLVGVNPVHGLYASFAGPVAGGLTASTDRMIIATTTAAALAAGSAVEHVDAADRAGAVVLITLLAGVAMIVAGRLRLGRYTRFVSHSVMLGFLTGVALNILLGQVPQLAGAPSEGTTALARAIHVLLHPRGIDPAALLVGLAAVVLLAGLRLTRLRLWATLVAVVVPTVLAALAGLSLVLVSDVGAFPRGFPVPQLPGLGALSPSLITGALAVAAIVLVQGAGVSETATNRDGQPSDLNRDFLAQGAGNVASSVFGGLPVGGSLGQTALNLASGARSRWAGVAAGGWMLVILVALSDLVGQVAMPTLSAVLMVSAAGSVQLGQLRAVVRTGPISRVALGTTFLATLFLSVPEAVGLGVALSLLLQLNQEASDLRVVQLLPLQDGTMRERSVPAVLADHQVTVLHVYGSLFYAGARTLQARLPQPAGSTGAAVVLRLRGHVTLGATVIAVLSRYAEQLAAAEGRLYLSGVDPALTDLLSDPRNLSGPVQVFVAGEILGESTRAAIQDAQAWTQERIGPGSL
jgi:SulP family sulfate permease